MKTIQIGCKTISKDSPPYFIADIGANHDGSIERAYKLIELAKEAGADAAKFQNFQVDKIVSNNGFLELGGQLSHQTKWKKPVYEIYKDASVPFDWTEKLKRKCDEIGIEYFTSPYDFESVDHIDPYVRVYKIGSGDITWLELIEYIAAKKKPVLLATGASSMEDVDRAMQTLQKRTTNIVLMQCNTNYTGSYENFRFINLHVLAAFRERFPEAILGLSDHTAGHATILGAIALGATVFEKHFTDDNSREGPDHKFAMNPLTWKAMVDHAYELYLALGDGVKRIEENELNSIIIQRRSIRLSKDLAAGAVIRPEDIEVLRPIPSDGIPPYLSEEVIGKKIRTNSKKGTHLTFKNIQE